MIRSRPRIVQVRLFFDCSSFSVSAPPVTILNPDIAIIITATGAAKYSKVPARI